MTQDPDHLQVFLSWSGAESETVARALKLWLPCFSDQLRPWMSREDLHAGQLWRVELAHRIKDSFSGIFCLTQENRESLWMAFECGALSSTVTSGKIIPLLIDLEPSRLADPFSAFQSLRANRPDAIRLLKALLGEEYIEDREQKRLFRAYWPLLNNVLIQRRSDSGAIEKALSDLEGAVVARKTLELLDVEFSPGIVRRGQPIRLEYVIQAEQAGTPVWLGASFVCRPGSWFNQVSEDEEVRLKSGVQRYTRLLTISEQAEPGAWGLNADVWFGPISDSDNSYPLARRWPLDKSLTILP